MCSRAVPPVKSVSRTRTGYRSLVEIELAYQHGKRRLPRTTLWGQRSDQGRAPKDSARHGSEPHVHRALGPLGRRVKGIPQLPPGLGKPTLRDQPSIAYRVNLLSE
jgi:hypothetical protein